MTDPHKNANWLNNLLTGGQTQAKAISKRNRMPLKTAADRYENQVNSFGTMGADPMASTYFQPDQTLLLREIESIYRYNWLGGRIIEALPNAAMQKGFCIKSRKNAQGNKIDPEGAEKVFKMLESWDTEIHATHHAYQARLYGGAAKINYINDGLPPVYPVNMLTIKSLDQSKICGRYYCRPTVPYSDPFDLKTFGKTLLYQVYEISLFSPLPAYQIHNSRLSWMDGSYLPDHLRIQNWGAGDSILVRVNEALKGFGSSIQALTATIEDFVTKVFQIEDLDDLIETNEDELAFRVRMADAKRSIHGTAVIGPEEDIKKISTPITGLPESINLQMDVVSAASGQPKSQLFGNMTGTLGSSSGKYDKDTWVAQVKDYQKKKYAPVIKDDMRYACAIQKVNFEDLELTWNDVAEKGEKETAETRKINAEAENIELQNEQMRLGQTANNQET